MEDKDKIKDLFASKLGSFELEAPASVWGGLDRFLSSQPAPDASSSSTSSTAHAASLTLKASIIKIAAIIVGVAIAITIGVLFISKMTSR
ncbi:MAG: hypothetical protein LBR26_15125 [Prevotella sp.]|jgi:hypothetical protein|nr:hypothetical protein [Prevotella sp.]